MDLTFANKSQTGTRVYASETLAALQREGRFDVCAVEGWGARRMERTGNVLTGARNLVWLWRELPQRLEREGAELVHVGAYLGPLRGSCPMVVNVLDTTTLRESQDFDWKWRLYARSLIPRTVRRAAAVITLSEHARGEIESAYGVVRGKIHVVYPGVGAEFRRAVAEDELTRVRERYKLPKNYVLFVGAQERRKNIPRLIEAVARARSKGTDVDLVLAGPPGSDSETIRQAIVRNGMEGRVVDAGYVSREDLAALYASARAFVYASRLEGFGMPPLEAMACGTPVIAAPNPPLPEVLGDAALMVANDGAEALAEGIGRVLSDAGLAQELGKRGQEHAGGFTWERTARLTGDVYAAVLASGGAR